MNRHSLSIITATLNSGVLLDRTIDSLRKQTYQNFQWIVIDGASTDETVEKLKKINFMQIELVSERDAGIADAWNKGLNRTKGDHILILNAGDTYDPEFIDTINKHCDPNKIVCCDARIMTESGKEIGIFKAKPHKLYRGMHIPHNFCVVPKRYYNIIGPYINIPFSMDFEWFHRYFIKFGVPGFSVLHQTLGSYYLGGKSDICFQQSLKMNEQILIENGTFFFTAKFYRISYMLKRIIRRKLYGMK